MPGEGIPMTDDELTYAAFISYASEDRNAAFEVCDRLEAAGLNCWIAPRNVRAGQDYGTEIIRGIEASGTIVLVLSQHSNASKFVKAEVERAYSKDKVVYPVRIEDVSPAKHLELFVSSSHWVDAFEGKLDDHFEVLVREISSLNSNGPLASTDAQAKPTKRSKLGKSRSQPLLFGVGAIAIIAIGLLLWQLGKKSPLEVQNRDQAPENSVAVLPFLNMSSDPEQEYFSDGISEELLNILAQIRDLRVAARTSSFQFKGRNLDIANVGVQLNVAHVLEGSVRKAGNRVRITAQLIDADTGFHLWSETFDRELDDIFAVQDEISQAIVAAMRKVLQIEESEPVPLVRVAASTEAYDEYLLGQHFMRTRTQSAIEAAAGHFERAIELDPAYSPAYAGSAIAWMLLQNTAITYGDLTLEEAVAKASPLAERALELDPKLAEAHAAMGFVYYQQQQFEEAENHWKRAVKINPNAAMVHSWLGNLMSIMGRYEEEFEFRRAAAELDPLSVIALNNYTSSLFLRGRYEDADKVMQRLKEIAPQFYHYGKSWQAWQRGTPAESIFALLDGLDIDPDDRRIPGGLTNMFGLLGLHDEAVRHASGHDRYLPYQWIADWATVLDIAQENYSANPDNRSATAALGQALLASGDIDGAAPLLEQYVEGFDDGIGPNTEIAGYVALIRKGSGDDAGTREILDPMNARLERALAGDLNNNSVRRLQALTALIEERQSDALAALEALSMGSSLEPHFVASLRQLTPLNKDPRFDAILARQAAHFAEQRKLLLARICGDDGWNNWQPLPATCEDQPIKWTRSTKQ